MKKIVEEVVVVDVMKLRRAFVVEEKRREE